MAYPSSGPISKIPTVLNSLSHKDFKKYWNIVGKVIMMWPSGYVNIIPIDKITG